MTMGVGVGFAGPRLDCARSACSPRDASVERIAADKRAGHKNLFAASGERNTLSNPPPNSRDLDARRRSFVRRRAPCRKVTFNRKRQVTVALARRRHLLTSATV